MVGQLRRNRYILFHWSSGKVIGVILLLCHNLILKCQQNLIHRFINSYGYDKGEVTAAVIVDDIVKTIEGYFLIALLLEKLATGDQIPNQRMLSYGQLVRMAVPIDEYPQKGKSIVKTAMKPVVLTYLASEDIESFRNGFTSRQLRIN